MKDNDKLVGRLNSIWIQGGASSRGQVERLWPELAEALDLLMVFTSIRFPEIEVDVQASLYQILAETGHTPESGTRLHAMVENIGRTEEKLLSRPIRKTGEPQCRANHASDVWPFVQRCVLAENHQFVYDHIDQRGERWRNEPCDGCKLIDRKRESLKPGDEDGYYDLQRAARHHIKECPNI